jgi:prepilin-type N-terminal cleavage/methylation domain-containing protein
MIKHLFKPLSAQSEAGFSLVEMLVVTIIVGVMAAVAVPNFMGTIERQKLNSANDQIYQAMRQAQSSGLKEKSTWQASFRQQGDTFEWAVHPAAITTDDTWTGKVGWNSLPPGIQMDAESTLLESGGVRRARFNYKGCPVTGLQDSCTQTSIQAQGRITLSLENRQKVKRCVIVSTLLGAMRTSKEQSKPDDKGRYCY